MEHNNSNYVKINMGMVIKKVTREQMDRLYTYDAKSNTATYSYVFCHEVGVCLGLRELDRFIKEHPEVKEWEQNDSIGFPTQAIKFFLSAKEYDYIYFKREWILYFLHHPDVMTGCLSGTIQLFNISDLYLCDKEKYINAYEYYSAY